MLTTRAYHKTSHILQKHKRYLFLIAIHNKAGCLIGAIIIYHTSHLHFPLLALYHHALVGNDAYGPAIYPGITAQNGFAIIFLELFQTGIVYNTLDDLLHIIWPATIGRYYTI